MGVEPWATSERRELQVVLAIAVRRGGAKDGLEARCVVGDGVGPDLGRERDDEVIGDVRADVRQIDHDGDAERAARGS